MEKEKNLVVIPKPPIPMQPHLCPYAKGCERAVVLLNVKETQVIVPITSGRVVEACVYTHKYLGGKADPPSL